MNMLGYGYLPLAEFQKQQRQELHSQKHRSTLEDSIETEIKNFYSPLVVQTVSEYVTLAVKLAHQPKLRAFHTEQILKRRDRLFQQPSAYSVLQEWRRFAHISLQNATIPSDYDTEAEFEAPRLPSVVATTTSASTQGTTTQRNRPPLLFQQEPRQKQQQQQQQQQKHAHREGPAGSGHKRLGQSPKREVQHDTIQLGDRMKMKFTSEYEVETEKGELHLINSYDKKYHPHQAGELKKESNREKRKAPHNPLAYNPDNDALIGSSLETMGTTTSRPITSQTPQRSTRTTPQQQQQQQQQQSLQEDSQVSVSQESDAESEVSYRRSLVKDDEELLSRSFSAGTDFFGRLPAKPIIPLRIEPKDVIIEGEDMVRIREKFQKLADSAERSTGIKGLSEVEKIRKKFTDDIKKVYGPKNFHFVSENHNKHAEKHGTSMKSPGIGSPTRVGTSGTGIGGDAPLDPVMEDQYFAQFSDADGVALQDLPIQPNLRMEGMDFSMVDGEEFGGAGIPPPHQQQRSDGDSAPATIHGSTTTSDGPEVYGLRLENFDFDEQNLFEGFKPIFDYPPQASAGHTGNGDADPESLKNLGIGKKNKPDLEMAQTVDLILS